MKEWGDALKTFVETTGPAGAIIAAIIVALVLCLIIFAKSAGLFDGTRTEHQKTEFQDRLIAQVDKLVARQEALQLEADRIETENDHLKDKLRELETSIALMRNQLRRAIDLLRAVREGRMPPEAIEAADIAEVA